MAYSVNIENLGDIVQKFNISWQKVTILTKFLSRRAWITVMGGPNDTDELEAAIKAPSASGTPQPCMIPCTDAVIHAKAAVPSEMDISLLQILFE